MGPVLMIAGIHIRSRTRLGASIRIEAICANGSPTTLACLVNLFTVELAGRCGVQVTAHQEKLEKVYLENDVLFNLR